MHKRIFGHAGWQVGEIGLGCWQLGGDFGPMDEKTALEVLHAAVDNGMDFFDTADVYGGGRSESLIGRFLKLRRAPVRVATKLGRGPGIYPDRYSLSGLRSATEASLRRLGLESADLTQLHCIPREELLRGEIFQWLRELKREGKIRAFGASVETMEEALICLEQEDLASLQFIFNIFRQDPADILFDKAAARGVALIVRLPLASGLLAGKFTPESRFSEGDHRHYNREGRAFSIGETFSGLPFDKGLDLAERLRPLVPPYMTMAQMALRWILDHDAVSVVIPGASRPGQVRDNAAASDLARLGQPLHNRLGEIYAEAVADHIRGAR